MMTLTAPRGIAVVDAGTTNSKVLLFDAAGRLLGERKTASVQPPAPPYRAVDGEALLRFLPPALAELDAILPIDRIVPSAHGSALALLDAAGDLALPMLHYTQEPPDDVVAEYRAMAPPFSEVGSPVARMTLTLGLQLYWQQSRFPAAFARVATIVPWGQYVAYRLSGRLANEVTAMGAQSHLWDIAANRFSSLARARGWDRLFAPMVNAWDGLGPLLPQLRPAAFRGDGVVVAGIHDSNANYLRYLAAGRTDFTLLSTGTWIIGFAPGADQSRLDPLRDTVTNSDIFGRTVPCCRFFGGREFEVVSGGAAADAASRATAARLIAAGSLAVPSFTDSGGPLPQTAGKGFFSGPATATVAERASLASIYCALMSLEAIHAASATGDIIVDGPFATNDAYLSVLAAISGRPVLASELREGTAAGAALLGHMTGNGVIPAVALDLREVMPIEVPALADYVARWRQLTGI